MHSNTHRVSKPVVRVYALTVLMFLVLVIGSGALRVSADTTYKINDNGKVSYHTTSATDPEVILDEAGLELGIDDTYTTEESNGYTEIHVQRVQMVTINNGGQILKTGTYGGTVEELLARLNLKLGEDDEIDVELSEKTFDGMEIVIDRIHRSVENYSKTLPFETEYVEDPNLPAGQEKVLSAGSDGEMLCTAVVTYENGVESSRRTLRTHISTQPVNQIVAVGTAKESRAMTGELVIGDGVIITEDGDVLTYTGTISVLATAYTCEGWGRPGITATGTIARVGAIAVDPRIIPYGTRMFIVSDDGEYIYGIATAEDTGHPDFIVGHRIDLYMDTEYECIQFGARNCTVYVLG